VLEVARQDVGVGVRCSVGKALALSLCVTNETQAQDNIDTKQGEQGSHPYIADTSRERCRKVAQISYAPCDATRKRTRALNWRSGLQSRTETLPDRGADRIRHRVRVRRDEV
jgi:hypothetical protein